MPEALTPGETPELPGDQPEKIPQNVCLNYFPEALYRQLWPMFRKFQAGDVKIKFPAFVVFCLGDYLEMLPEYFHLKAAEIGPDANAQASHPDTSEEIASLRAELARAKAHALAPDEALRAELEQAEEKIKGLEILLDAARRAAELSRSTAPAPEPVQAGEPDLAQRYEEALEDLQRIRENWDIDRRRADDLSRKLAIHQQPDRQAEALRAGADAVIAEAARITGPGFSLDKLRSFDRAHFERIAGSAFNAVFEKQ